MEATKRILSQLNAPTYKECVNILQNALMDCYLAGRKAGIAECHYRHEETFEDWERDYLIDHPWPKIDDII